MRTQGLSSFDCSDQNAGVQDPVKAKCKQDNHSHGLQESGLWPVQATDWENPIGYCPGKEFRNAGEFSRIISSKLRSLALNDHL